MRFGGYNNKILRQLTPPADYGYRLAFKQENTQLLPQNNEYIRIELIYYNFCKNIILNIYHIIIKIHLNVCTVF